MDSNHTATVGGAFCTVDSNMSSSVTTPTSNASEKAEEPYGIHVINCISNFLGVNAILLNVLFLFCIYRVPNNDSAYNRFIKNLSVCDIFGALFFLLTMNWPKGPFAHIQSDDESNKLWIHGSPYVFRSIPWMFFTAYMFTLNCLSMSQYVASCKPHLYARIRENKIVTVILLGVWGVSSLQIVIPILVLASLSGLPVREAFSKLVTISKVEMIVWLLVYITSTCVSITLNVLVYIGLHKLRNKQDRRSESTSALSGGANTRAKNEALITILCLSLASILCRLPLPLVGMLLITYIEKRFGFIVMTYVLDSVALILYLVFFVEPVIYMCRMPDVRALLKETFVRVFRGGRVRWVGRCMTKREDRYSLAQMTSTNGMASAQDTGLGLGQETVCSLDQQSEREVVYVGASTQTV